MSIKGFVDADGDKYTVEAAPHGNIVLTYQNGEESGESLFIFRAEDAAQLVALIIEAVQEVRK